MQCFADRYRHFNPDPKSRALSLKRRIRELQAELDQGGKPGFVVIEAANSLACLQLLQSDTRIDLLVTDIGLPDAVYEASIHERNLHPHNTGLLVFNHVAMLIEW